MTPRSRTATALHRTAHGVHLMKTAAVEVATGGITQLYVYMQARTSAIISQRRGSFSSRNYCPSTCALTLCCCRCFSSSSFAVHGYHKQYSAVRQTSRKNEKTIFSTFILYYIMKKYQFSMSNTIIIGYDTFLAIAIR